MAGEAGGAMKLLQHGWRVSTALLALWPILLLPGLMSLAASTSGFWRTCTRSWFTGFLCTSVYYPLLIAVLAWVVLPWVRARDAGLAHWLGWFPALLLSLTFALAQFGW